MRNVCAILLLAIAPAGALAQTSGQAAYQAPEAITTPANAPAIPTATPAGAVAPTAQAPEVQDVVESRSAPTPAKTAVAPAFVTPVANHVAAESGSTLPVTGFDALLLVAIAGVAALAGIALRTASR